MRTLALALALALSFASPALAFDPAAMTEAEKTAFGAAVRDYLMANPEVLMESIAVLEQRRADEAAQNDKALVAHFEDEIFNDGFSWVGGNPEGDVTVVEFVDYRCGVCRSVYQDVEDLLSSDGNIRLIFKEFPILGEESLLAARFAIAVRQVAGAEAYKTAHDKLMTMRGAVTLDSLGALADELGVERAAILDRLNTEEVTAEIRKTAQLAEKMGINGTPTFVVGPELLRGAPREGIASVVAGVRAGDQG